MEYFNEKWVCTECEGRAVTVCALVNLEDGTPETLWPDIMPDKNSTSHFEGNYCRDCDKYVTLKML